MIGGCQGNGGVEQVDIPVGGDKKVLNGFGI